MTVHETHKPKIIASIHDAVVAVDVETAFGAAGFDVLNVRSNLSFGEMRSALRTCTFVLLDQDIGWEDLVTLGQRAQAHGIPVGLFVFDDAVDALPPQLAGALRWQKPFDTDVLVNDVRAASADAPKVVQGA